MTYDLDTAREIFRNAVLEALDGAAAKVFGEGNIGAADRDLPALFPAIDGQLAILSERYEHALYDNFVGSEKWQADRDFLRGLGHVLPDDLAAPGR